MLCWPILRNFFTQIPYFLTYIWWFSRLKSKKFASKLIFIAKNQMTFSFFFFLWTIKFWRKTLGNERFNWSSGKENEKVAGKKLNWMKLRSCYSNRVINNYACKFHSFLSKYRFQKCVRNFCFVQLLFEISFKIFFRIIILLKTVNVFKKERKKGGKKGIQQRLFKN